MPICSPLYKVEVDLVMVFTPPYLICGSLLIGLGILSLLPKDLELYAPIHSFRLSFSSFPLKQTSPRPFNRGFQIFVLRDNVGPKNVSKICHIFPSKLMFCRQCIQCYVNYVIYAHNVRTTFEGKFEILS